MLMLRRRNDEADAPPLGGCDRHSFERAVGACGSCRSCFCEECLIHPFGPSKPGLCINCALVKAGVRR